MKILLVLSVGAFIYGCSVLIEKLYVTNGTEVNVHVSLNNGGEVVVEPGESEYISLPVVTALHLVVREVELKCMFEISTKNINSRFSVENTEDSRNPFMLRIGSEELNPISCSKNGF